MLRPLICMAAVIAATAMDLPTVPDQTRLDEALARAVRWLPPATAPAWARHEGLVRVSAAAFEARRYAVAAAAESRITERWPHHGLPWGNLACALGFQGRWDEALAATATAAARPWHDAVQVAGIRAAWLWQMGDHAGATAAIQAMVDDGGGMAAACLVLFHVSAGTPSTGWRDALARLATPGQDLWWRRWVQVTPLLDAHRHEPWYRELAGPPAGSRHGAWGRLDTTPVPTALSPAPVPPAETTARAHLAAAIAAIEAGAWGAAAVAAAAAREAAPLPEAVVAEAIAHAAQGDRRRSMGCLRDLDRLADPLGGWTVDGAGVFNAGAAAITRLENAGDHRPVALLCVIQGTWYLAWDDHREARSWFDAALEWDPQIPEAWNGRGRSWIHEDDTRAAADFRAAISLWPRYPDARTHLAMVLAMAGDAEGAANALAQVPETGDPLRITARALTAIAGGDATAAVSALRKAVHEDPWNHRWPALLREVTTQSMWQRHPHASIALGDLIRGVAPWNTEAILSQAGDLELLGDLAGAEGRVRLALAEGDPESPDAWLALAWLRAKAGDRAHARAITGLIARPVDERMAGHWHAQMAMVAAALDDAEATRAHLEASMDPTRGARIRQWLAFEPDFARWRGEPWFAALLVPPSADGDRH
jgi:tetratricopeptide (TPR) repeat protein